MNSADFTTTLILDQSPDDVFEMINQVNRWWTENITGTFLHLKDEFTVAFSDIHVSTQQVIESIPGQKIVWLVTDSSLNHFANKQEWTGTTIHFDIALKGDKTQLQFTHIGLVPVLDCYQSCTQGWTHYIDKLFTTRLGNPALKQ
ncbi:SRPBCC domain-containing protein [Spirosoma sp. HMF4905]|uniref:SRPBCC domain-containing protein n=1 Tax=Spirosoma arboris TaxID=2682092 RepID=A0A7K1SEP9_9BACT|nr:SRPBCC domain-containing protein [Spirosoma arboris]MVM32285.1 SRPBCC domain-containing protein [Spirosoma arboris]